MPMEEVWSTMNIFIMDDDVRILGFLTWGLEAEPHRVITE